MKISPLAGKPAPPEILVNVPKLVTAYYTGVPDPKVPAQRVAFGTSGHRGSSFNLAFNEWHILAITQAICLYRKSKNIVGPLYLGIDTHALSVPACATALEVLAANGVEVMLAEGDEYTPTPVISHAILTTSLRPLIPEHQLVAAIAWVVLGLGFCNQFCQRYLLKCVYAQNL